MAGADGTAPVAETGDVRGECIAATTAFYAGLDRFDYDLVLGALAPDAVWERHDGSHKGHEAIGAILEARSTDVLTAHMVFNPVVEMLGPDSAVVRFSLLILAGDAKASPPAGRVAQVRHSEDRLSRIGGRWLIARKSSDLAFNIG